MQEWNTVISVNEYGYRKALDLFAEFGEVRRTEFFNVLLLRATALHRMLETLRTRALEQPGSLAFLTRLIPIEYAFIFQSSEEFENKAKEVALRWVSKLAGKTFFVRIHRRGFKGRLSSPGEERFLDTVLLEALEKAGTPGKISFKDAETVIVIETIGHWAGLSLITREYRERYPFMRVA